MNKVLSHSIFPISFQLQTLFGDFDFDSATILPVSLASLIILDMLINNLQGTCWAVCSPTVLARIKSGN